MEIANKNPNRADVDDANWLLLAVVIATGELPILSTCKKTYAVDIAPGGCANISARFNNLQAQAGTLSGKPCLLKAILVMEGGGERASLSALLGAVTRYPTAGAVRHDASHNGLEEAPVPPPAGPAASTTARCLETMDPWSPCLCHLEMCIGWYPCGLKYCKGKGDGKAGSVAGSYRCGIKTCKKCSLFSYYVRQKQLCLWDE
ncbi:hypothetical protein C0J52_27961 [Blattella germanica]|nr:hypothetical protein C0J52_27961 [Blattella germanica]